MWTTEQNAFLESMADAAESVVKLFDGKIVYINVMKNMSVDCDCWRRGGGPVYERYRHSRLP